MDLTAFFQQVPDPRRAQGQRYPLPAFLWLAFLAVASGHGGYRAMGKFARSNAPFLCQQLGLRHGVPAHVSFRSLLQGLEQAAFCQLFNNHLALHAQAGDSVAGDGQSLCSTLTDAHGAGQAFVSVVGLYCQRTGLTAALRGYTDKKSGELTVLRDLLPLLHDLGCTHKFAKREVSRRVPKRAGIAPIRKGFHWFVNTQRSTNWAQPAG